MEITGNSQLQATQPPVRLIESIRRSGELTIEAWIKPSSLDQKGPARIVTLSANGSQRNFTLGQDGDRYDIRLRTTQTGVNGTPSLASDCHCEPATETGAQFGGR
ncbi:MAG: LamG domain-containing protein [Rhodobacteraceae bacterium]|nr:LamG domain-containing protein [Paracoccaceae bacterium]